MRRASTRMRLRHYAVAALVLAGVADALFFDRLGQPLGLSVPVFAALLALAVALCNRHSGVRSLAPRLLFLGLALAALVETVDAKSLALALACLGLFAMAAAGRLPSPVKAPAALARFLVGAPLALPRDNGKRVRARRRIGRSGSGGGSTARAWLVWIMPLAFATGFVLLLAAGNPILDQWIALIDPLLLFDALEPTRIAFWIAIAAMAWPFLRPRLRRTSRPGASPAVTEAPVPAAPLSLHPTPPWVEHVYGKAAILRALILFNAVFGVQTLLDAAYLWSGVALPEGIGYADYAHRGAYLLVVTALLAAAFVLVALRPEAEAADDRRIRALVFLWIGQNVVLVLSAMLRLDLYVDVYALTHWRLAAFVWMGIVAAGLVLICVRIAGHRTNRWLVGANLCVLALVVTGSCFVDDRALVAGFNVAHSRELSGQGVHLDIDHIASLGPAAIPAIDRYLAHAAAVPQSVSASPMRALELQGRRFDLVGDLRAAARDWRSWTFRNWRLSRYLETHAAPPPLPMPMGPPPPPVPGSN